MNTLLMSKAGFRSILLKDVMNSIQNDIANDHQNSVSRNQIISMTDGQASDTISTFVNHPLPSICSRLFIPKGRK